MNRPAPTLRTSAGEIARAIVQGIESGELHPGERLVEADLCLRFATGRQTVREALQQLKAAGVVAIVPNRGAHILAISAQQAVQTLEVTELLFGLAARTAARRIAGGADAASLEAAIGELDACDEASGYMHARRHLFGALAQIAANPELTRVLDQARVHVMRGQFGFATMRVEHAGELAEVGRLVLSGRSAEAESAARRYVERIRLRLEQS